jgi:hypothetical protein
MKERNKTNILRKKEEGRKTREKRQKKRHGEVKGDTGIKITKETEKE